MIQNIMNEVTSSILKKVNISKIKECKKFKKKILTDKV